MQSSPSLLVVSGQPDIDGAEVDMAESRDHIRMLAIQIRESDFLAQHERHCLMESCGLQEGQIQSANLVQTPDLPWERIAEANVVVIGGAGAYSATKDYDFMPQLSRHIIRMVESDIPLFGSCWGHQYIARALGGEVITDYERREIGQFDVQLTSSGQTDRVFGSLPAEFRVLMGHHDRVSRLPDGAVELAVSPRCPHQAFCIESRPVYCTQFHAEMSPARLLERLEIYRDSYVPDGEDLESLQQGIQATPDAERILPRFLDEFVPASGK